VSLQSVGFYDTLIIFVHNNNNNKINNNPRLVSQLLFNFTIFSVYGTGSSAVSQKVSKQFFVDHWSRSDVPAANYTVKALHEGQIKSCELLLPVSCDSLGSDWDRV